MFNNPYFPQQQLPAYIQRIQTPETRVSCWFVDSVDELNAVRAELNTLYIGINTKTGEIYTRQLKNDGTIDSFIYKQFEANCQESETKSILDKLALIEKRLEGLNNVDVTANSSTISVRDVSESSGDATIQSNDGRKKRRATDSNVDELRSI